MCINLILPSSELARETAAARLMESVLTYPGSESSKTEALSDLTTIGVCCLPTFLYCPTLIGLKKTSPAPISQ
jgi:hypothetical protein